MLVALAGKAVADLAKGLRKNFYPYSAVVSVRLLDLYTRHNGSLVQMIG